MNELEKAVIEYVDKIPNKYIMDKYFDKARQSIDKGMNATMDKAHELINSGMDDVRNKAKVYKDNPEKISNEICTLKDIVCTKDIMYHLNDNYNKVCLVNKDNDTLACNHFKNIIKQFDNKCNVLVDVCKYPNGSNGSNGSDGSHYCEYYFEHCKGNNAVGDDADMCENLKTFCEQ